MGKNAFNKDPNSVEWFGVDWSERLQGDEVFAADTIASSSWVVPTGLTQADAMSMTKAAGVKLSGGVVGTAYQVTNRIVTAVNGETLDGTIEIYVVEE